MIGSSVSLLPHMIEKDVILHEINYRKVVCSVWLK